jgi:hypothetical protein
MTSKWAFLIAGLIWMVIYFAGLFHGERDRDALILAFLFFILARLEDIV